MPTPVTIILTKTEMEVALFIGDQRARNVEVNNLKRPDATVWPNEVRKPHRMGAVSEAVVAKYLNRYWLGNMEYFRNKPDVCGVGVKSTLYPDGHMILHKVDDLHVPYVLVILTREGRCSLVGWIYGDEGIQGAKIVQREWSTEYWITQRSLRDMGDLKRMLVLREQARVSMEVENG